MYHPKDIIEVLAGNVIKTRSPFGIPKNIANRWWQTIQLPAEGEALLFTGMMYQFIPFIEKTTHYLQKYEDTWLAEWMRLVKYPPKILFGLGLAMITKQKEKQKSTQILKDIAFILSQSKVSYYYKPDLDEYSGILLYDLGDQENFIRHAKFVANKLNKAGVQKIITVDPHTTYALKVLYPKYLGVSFDVRTYFELVNLESANGKGRVTLHDPCFYGRYLGLSDAPRKVLNKLGVECLEVRNSGTFTSCCGGPVESISPNLSKEIVDRRIEELKATGVPIIAFCPICLGNLKKSGVPVEDLSTMLARCASFS